MNLGLLEIHAAEKISAHPLWKCFRFECFPKSQMETLYVEVTGAVCAATYSRGKREGQINWSKRDRSTERTVIITPAEHTKWLIEWEKRTGLCSHCEGKGQVFHSWNHLSGTTYRTCPVCNGSTSTTQSITPPPENPPIPEQATLFP